MRLTLALLLPLLILSGCGPQPPSADQWSALSTAASAGGTASAIGTRCGFDTTEMSAAFDRAAARYVLSEQQKAELALLGKSAAAELAGEPLPAGHQLCSDGAAMRDRVMGVLARL